MKQFQTSFLSLLLLSLPAQAQLSAYDGFASTNYTAGQLFGQNPSVLGFTNAWAGGTNIHAGGASQALTYSGILSDDTGGAYSVAVGNRTGRDFATALGGNNTYYMSLMMENSAVGTQYRAFELYSFGNRNIQVGANGDMGDSGASWGMRALDNASLVALTPVAAVANETVFAVLKLTFSTNTSSDSVRLWINPSDLSDEALSTNYVELTGLEFVNNSFNNFRFAAFNGTSQSYWDELRVGSTWGDVTPVPEPSTYALLGLSGLALAAYRLRRRSR